MADMLIRDLDPAILQRLKTSARDHGRSLQAEIHEVLRRATDLQLARTRQLSKAWHRRLAGRRFSDSTKLIRDDRDSR